MQDKSAYEIVSGRYGTFTVFANDIGAATKSLLTYGEWAENEITFLRRFVPSGGTVLDIGAYIGTHTLAFARFAGPQGRVVAIEAQPDTFEVLRKNVEANLAAECGHRVQIENAVVSSEAGQVAIPTIDVRSEASFGSASLVGALADTLSTAGRDEDSLRALASVRAITIDSLGLQRCELIKIDVEGLEPIVLRGALRTLEQCSPTVYCECNSLAAGLKSMALLESAGYKVFAHVVNAFNADNFFGAQQNIFDNAREVGLLGLPADRAAQISQWPVRGCELLLDILDADDLALALLNKPQYQGEILSRSSAARTGGDEFLMQYNTYRLECDRLQRENDALQSLRSEERAASEQAQAVLDQRSRDVAELHDLLTLREADVARLQASFDELKRYAAEIEVVLNQRHIDVSELRAAVTRKDQHLDDLRQLLAQRDAEITRAK